MITAEFPCSVCHTTIVLDDTVVSKNGKQIPIDRKTGKPHPRHPTIAQALHDRQKIKFEDAFPKRCLICDMVYQVKYLDCPFCQGDIENSSKFSSKALTEWAKSKGMRIPLLFIKYLR